MPWCTWDAFNKIESSAAIGIIIILRTSATYKSYESLKNTISNLFSG